MWRSLQWRSPVARRAATFATLAVLGALPTTVALAQGGAPAPANLCRCFVGDDSTRAGARGNGWALLGAAGLALLAGVPIGGAGVPGGIPFVEGPAAAPTGAPLAEVVALPPGVPGAPPVLPGLVRPGAAAPVGPVAGPLETLPVPTMAFVPPKTATHLPLLVAAGVLLMGGGGLLARRQARLQRRRRRRLVTL